MSSTPASTPRSGRIVSSSHLAAGPLPSLSELEYGLIVASHAFSRWMVRCMTAAGQPGLSAVEVMVLHTIRNREAPKTMADICLVLDIGDVHVVNYAIKKLQQAGLVSVGRSGKEKTVAISEAGLELCARYAAVREGLLLSALASANPGDEALSKSADILRFMSGFYDQATRAAATMR